jgi:MFS family permease
VSLLRNRNFLFLVSAASLSFIGDSLRSIAITYWVLQSSDFSPIARATVLLVGVLPPLLLGPVAGVFSDRWDRRITMIFSDLLRAGFSVGLLIAFLVQSLTLTLVLVALSAAVSLFFEPARFALVPKVVGKRDDLVRANSIIETCLRLVTIFGPAVGSVLYFQVGGQWSFLIDAMTFLVSAALVWSVKLPAGKPQQTPRANWRSFVTDSLDGLSYIKRTPVAFYFMLTTTGMTVISNINSLAIVFLITKVLNRPAGELAWVLSLSGFAQVVAGTSVALLAASIRPAPLLVGSLSVIVASQFAMGAAPNMVVLAVVVFVSAVANAPYSISFDTVMHQSIDERFLGRVYGIWDALDAALRVALIGVGGVLLTQLDTRWVIIGAGGLSLLCLAVGYFGLLPTLRKLTETQQSATSDPQTEVKTVQSQNGA